MPAAAPILITAALGALSGGAGAVATGASTNAILAAVLANAALGAAVGSLSLLTKPKKQKSPREVVESIQTNTQRNQPLPVVFGRGRLGGTMIMYPAGSGANHYWGTRLKDNQGRAYLGHIVIALCEGPLGTKSVGNHRADQLPTFEYYQQLVEQKVEPEFKSGTIEDRRNAAFYFDLNRGTPDQPIHDMVLDQDQNIAAGRDPKPCGFSIDDGVGGLILAGSHMPIVPFANTATEACQLYLGQNYAHISTTTRDVIGPDLTLQDPGSNGGSNTGDSIGAVLGYDAYSETFFWTLTSSSGVSAPFGIARIHRAGAHGWQHTAPPSSVSGTVSRAWYLGRHDIVVMQDPDDGSLFHIGCWGLTSGSSLWESYRPATGQISGGYDNDILGQHLDEHHGILHTLHEDDDGVYIVRWTLLNGRIERLTTDLESATFVRFMYSPDIHAYVVCTSDGSMFAVGGENGETIASTDAVDVTGAKGLFVSGNRIGVVNTTGVTFWDLTDPDQAFDELGDSTTGLGKGNFGGTLIALQNTWTGHITMAKVSSATLAFINFIASVLEEVEDISAMGTPGQDEFQDFWGRSLSVIGDTFTWETGNVQEPFFQKVDPPVSEYTRSSGDIILDVPAGADRLSFGSGSTLDDILILVKPDEDVTDDWDGMTARPTVTFTIPSNSILIANTHGSYMSEEDADYYATCPKIFTDGDHELVLPDGSLDPTTVDDYHALVDAGFNVQFFADGVSKAELDANGFIISGQLRCKLIHICCGRGEATIVEMGFVSNEIPDADPDTVAGWIRDWSTRQYNAWSLTRLEGKSSLAAAIWNSLVQVERETDTSAVYDTARWGAGLSSDFFNISSFEHLHSRCVAGWRYPNKLRTVPAGSGDIGSASAQSSASGAITGAVNFVQTYRYAERYKLDLVLDTQLSASDLITSQMLACCNGYRYMLGDQLHVGMQLPGTFPVWHFQDDVITDSSVKVSLVGRNATLNRVRLQFREVRDESRINIVQVDTEFEQNRYGRVSSEELTLNGISRRGQAELVGQQVLDIAATQRRAVEFKTSFVGYAVVPNDVIEVTYRNTGLSRTKLKVVNFEEGDKRSISISGTEHKPVLGSLGSPQPGAAPIGSVGSDVGSEQLPGSCEEQTGSTGSGIRWFNGGAAYPAGCYDIFYLTNCYKLAATEGNYAVEGYDVVTRDADNNVTVLLAAPAVANPPDGFHSQEEAVAANAGQSDQFHLAVSGPIGLHLRNPPKYTNFGDLGPAPTYQLCICGADIGSDSVGSDSEPATYRQARTPTDSKPGSLVNVWLPTAEIPPGPVDYNFYNVDDGSCYYIDYDDPAKTTHGTIPSAWEALSISDDNVDCNAATVGCVDLCFDASDDRDADIDKQWADPAPLLDGENVFTKARWYIGDDGVSEARGHSIDNALIFEPGIYCIEYDQGAYYKTFVNDDDETVRRWFLRKFGLYKLDLVTGIDIIWITPCDPDPAPDGFSPIGGYASNSIATSTNHPHRGEGGDEGRKAFFKLDHRSKLYLLPIVDTDGGHISDTPETEPPPTWRIRCLSCNEYENPGSAVIKLSDGDIVTLTVLVYALPSKGAFISGPPGGAYESLYGSHGLTLELLPGLNNGVYGLPSSAATPPCTTSDFSVELGVGQCLQNFTIRLCAGDQSAVANISVSPQYCVVPPNGTYTIPSEGVTIIISDPPAGG